MVHQKISALFAVLVVISSCSKTPMTYQDNPTCAPQEHEWAPGVISVKVPGNDRTTKVGYGSDGSSYSMLWHAGDRLQFVNLSDEANIDACLKADGDGASTTFSGNIVTWLGRSDVVAIYPQITGLYDETGASADQEFGPQHVITGGELILDSEHVCVKLPNNATGKVCVIPGNNVTNGIYIALGHGAIAESQDNYAIPPLEFHQATCLVDADFTGFSKPISEVSFSSEYDLFYHSMFVNPETGEVNWPEGISKADYRCPTLDYSVIRNDGETGNRMYLPLLPANVGGKAMEIRVTEGDRNAWGEDVQCYTFSKDCMDFERNRMYSLTLDKADGQTSAAPAVSPAELDIENGRISFSYGITEDVQYTTSFLGLSAAEEDVIGLLEGDDIAFVQQDGHIRAEGSFEGLDYGTKYWLTSCMEGDCFSRWISQEFTMFNPSVSVPSISLSRATKSGSKIYLSGTCRNSNLIEFGFCYNNTGSPTLDDTRVEMPLSTISNGSFSTSISVTRGKKYYIRAYAINEGGVGYSSVKTVSM